jgi:anhydro-N-acetylmuramic acid kinase
MNNTVYYGIGLMSGSSLDGMDICAVKFWRSDDGLDEDWSYEITQARTEPYSSDWTDKLKSAETLPGDKLVQLHSAFGQYIGKLVCKFIKDFQLDGQIQFIASHGHTIFHQPENGFTLQLGDGEATASMLSVPLVCNFRSKDVALGGVGAPLVPVGEKFLFPKYRFCLNLGGIANITIDHNKAFDICPCNMLLNYLAEEYDPTLAYDAGGNLASKGKLLSELLQSLNSLPYYQQPPPKALGREWFQATVLPLLEKQLSQVGFALYFKFNALKEDIA